MQHQGKPVSQGNGLDDLKATFMRNVEHELRTPITIIQGYAHLLSEGALGNLEPDQQHAIFTITNRASQLQILVERITTLLAVKANLAARSPVDLRQMVNRVFERRSRQAVEAELTLLVRFTSDDCLLTQGQPYHLEQLLDCLAENALKFTPPGGQVEILLESEPGWGRITVSDNGIGIPQEQLEHIFDAFYQVDGSTTRPYGGLGLGLAVVKAVTEAYGGEIRVESRLNLGSRFILRLPLTSVNPVSQVEKPAQALANEAKSQRILIVDDEELVALTLKEGLAKLPNCEVVTAMGGRQALHLFEKEPFDLLFTDYRMPDMDGLYLSTQIREQYPATIIVMITAHSDEDLVEQALQLPIRHILNKPVEFSQIRQVALDALTHRSERSPLSG